MDDAAVDITSGYNDSHAQVRDMIQTVDIHSHPDKNGTKGGSRKDQETANPQMKNAVYHKETKTLFEYDQHNSSINSIKINTMDDLIKYVTK